MARAGAIQKLIQRLGGPLIISSIESRRTAQRGTLTFEVVNPTAGEQKEIWRQVLSTMGTNLNGHVDQFVAQFNLNVEKIESARAEVMGQKLLHESKANDASFDFGEALWDACRTQARPKLDDLAQRIEPAATWDDLVLPRFGLETLHEIAVHVRRRHKVYETWGFVSKGLRGLGISALFSGVSGTGKTMAAEVLASELRLDLHRIDLSAVVSKYIGETERTCAGSSTRPKKAERSCCSMKPMRCLASAAKSKTVTIATRISRSVICCSAWRLIAGWRF